MLRIHVVVVATLLITFTGAPTLAQKRSLTTEEVLNLVANKVPAKADVGKAVVRKVANAAESAVSGAKAVAVTVDKAMNKPKISKARTTILAPQGNPVYAVASGSTYVVSQPATFVTQGVQTVQAPMVAATVVAAAPVPAPAPAQVQGKGKQKSLTITAGKGQGGASVDFSLQVQKGGASSKGAGVTKVHTGTFAPASASYAMPQNFVVASAPTQVAIAAPSSYVAAVATPTYYGAAPAQTFVAASAPAPTFVAAAAPAPTFAAAAPTQTVVAAAPVAVQPTYAVYTQAPTAQFVQPVYVPGPAPGWKSQKKDQAARVAGTIEGAIVSTISGFKNAIFNKGPTFVSTANTAPAPMVVETRTVLAPAVTAQVVYAPTPGGKGKWGKRRLAQYSNAL